MFMAAYPVLSIYFNGYIAAGRAREFAYAIAKKRTVPMQPHSRMLSYFGEPLLCGALEWRRHFSGLCKQINDLFACAADMCDWVSIRRSTYSRSCL